MKFSSFSRLLVDWIYFTPTNHYRHKRLYFRNSPSMFTFQNVTRNSTSDYNISLFNIVSLLNTYRTKKSSCDGDARLPHALYLMSFQEMWLSLELFSLSYLMRRMCSLARFRNGQLTTPQGVEFSSLSKVAVMMTRLPYVMKWSLSNFLFEKENDASSRKLFDKNNSRVLNGRVNYFRNNARVLKFSAILVALRCFVCILRTN